MAKERVERDEEDLVRLYLTDIGQYPLLTKDDEVRLAQQIEFGNAARGEFLDGAKTLTPTKKRELRRTAREGDDAHAAGSGVISLRGGLWPLSLSGGAGGRGDRQG